MSAKSGALVGKRLGKYELLALLAMGGSAEIYLARIGGEAGFVKHVVVKCLHEHLAEDPVYIRMFLDEARIAACLDHSNIVQTLELGKSDGRYFLVMEYLAGMSLSFIFRKARTEFPGRRLSIDISLALSAQACAGLHYAHNKRSPDGSLLKLVHRDISPQNLVISYEGILKIVDFGIAKAEKRETETQSGTIKGKFAYMSPEQCKGEHIDNRTDVFAIGTVIHELVTGRRLFKRASTYDTYQAIIAGNVPHPSDVNHELDPRIDPVIMKALAYRRDDRYQNAEELGEALLQILHRRGRYISSSDISNYFDQNFPEEIAQHQNQISALMTGDSKEVTSTMHWDLANQNIEREDSEDAIENIISRDLSLDMDLNYKDEDQTRFDPQPPQMDHAPETINAIEDSSSIMELDLEDIEIEEVSSSVGRSQISTSDFDDEAPTKIADPGSSTSKTANRNVSARAIQLSEENTCILSNAQSPQDLIPQNYFPTNAPAATHSQQSLNRFHSLAPLNQHQELPFRSGNTSLIKKNEKAWWDDFVGDSSNTKLLVSFIISLLMGLLGTLLIKSLL